jgi:spore coat-associated protein N
MSRTNRVGAGRIGVLASSPKKTLGALAALTVAVAVAVGSGATFTSQSANPSNAFSAGILSQSNSKAGAAVLTASNMIPGGSATGSVTITNTGNVSGAFTLAESNVTHVDGTNGGNLVGYLDLTVTDTTVPAAPVVVYTGKLSALPATSAGTIAASATRTYSFVVAMPQGGVPGSLTTGDNAFQGSTASADFTWTSTT